MILSYNEHRSYRKLNFFWYSNCLFNQMFDFNLTTPWPKARKNLNLRSKFKDFSCAFGQGVGILFFVGVFFPTIWHPRGGSFVCAVFEANLLFAQFLGQISSFSRHFLETLTETGSIHWVGVQTWLRSSHEGKRWWHPRGGSFVCAVLDANLLLFAPLFRNTYRDRFYTLGRCSNLAAKQPWR